MRYAIRFRARTKEEFMRARKYSAEFGKDLDAWLTDIANAATRGAQSDSVDFLKLLEEGAEISQPTWKETWKKWWAATPMKKIHSLLVVLRKRTLPWQLRATSRWFGGILNAFDCEIHAYYEVDHVNQQVVFVKFTGLPGEEY